MKTSLNTIITLACAACLGHANAENSLGEKQLQSFQKNLARQHLSSNLFLFDPAAQKYVGTEAAAAWLDDDVSTGWPALAGKQNYLLQFSGPQVVTNFSLSTAPVEGTVTIYSGDEMKAPGDASWRVLAKDVAISAINQKKLQKSFNRQAKFILIETNITNPGPIFSLYAYGERSAANDSIAKREQPLDVSAALGEFVNQQTSFNVSSIYSQGRVSFSNGGGASVSWQKAIDDNSESAISVKPSVDSGMVVNFGDSRTASRIAILADAATKGKVDIFLLAEAPAFGQPVALEGVQPSVSLTFDGSNARASADFDDTTAVAMAVRWTPETAGQAMNVREVNTFANLSLADYEVSEKPAAIAQGPSEEPADTTANKTASTEPASNSEREMGTGTDGKDGKEILAIGEGPDRADYKGGGGKETKGVLDPVGAGPGSGYFPGGLGFPPNLSNRRLLPPVKLTSP